MDLIDTSRVSRILVISLSNIGDCVIALPVLRVLRAAFENARIDLACGKAPFALFQNSPDLGNVFVYDKKWGLFEKWRWVGELAKEKYDLVIDLRHTLIPLLIGARYHTRLIRKRPKILSVREKHLSLLRDLGLDVTRQKPIALFGSGEIHSVDQKLRSRGFHPDHRYAVVVPGANSSTKRWTLKGFADVTRFLVDELRLRVVLVGGPDEDWSGLAGPNIFDLTGETSLKELAALIAQSVIVVSNDSSAMQIAQESGVRVVSLFGPTNPWKYALENGRSRVVRLDLECSPCEKAQCQIERRICLDDLKAEGVNQVIREMLSSCHSRFRGNDKNSHDQHQPNQSHFSDSNRPHR